MELEDLTEKVIGCAITVHKTIGPGFLESIYENALVIELKRGGLRVESQLSRSIQYRDVEDIHFAQVRSYLKALGLKHGLLLNFASMPLTIKRVIFESITIRKA